MVQPDSRQARRRARRMEEILRATEEVLDEVGYRNISLDAVAAKLDLTKASLYYYYPHKDALLLACLEAISERGRTALSGAVTAAETPIDQMRALIVAQVKFFSANPHFIRFFIDPRDLAPELRKRARVWRRRNDDRLRKIIETGQAAGDFEFGDIDVARHCLHGAVNNASMWLSRSPKGHDIEKAAHQVADIVLGMFLPR